MDGGRWLALAVSILKRLICVAPLRVEHDDDARAVAEGELRKVHTIGDVEARLCQMLGSRLARARVPVP